MLDDPRNMPIVLENSIRLSRLYLFHLRGNVVHKNVVRTFKIVPLKEYKSAGDGPKAFRINSINDFHARSVELEKHGGHDWTEFLSGGLCAIFMGSGVPARAQREEAFDGCSLVSAPIPLVRLGGLGRKPP